MTEHKADGVGAGLAAAGRFLADERVAEVMRSGDVLGAQKLMLGEDHQHRAEVFFEDATGEWGWQCYTCGAEETGLGSLDDAEEARDNYVAEAS